MIPPRVLSLFTAELSAGSLHGSLFTPADEPLLDGSPAVTFKLSYVAGY